MQASRLRTLGVGDGIINCCCRFAGGASLLLSAGFLRLIGAGAGVGVLRPVSFVFFFGEVDSEGGFDVV